MKVRVTLSLFVLVSLSVPTQAQSNDEICSVGLRAFTDTIYPALRQGPCVSCHESGPGPAYDSPDAAQAYLSVLNYVDFANPAQSRLVVRAGNGHHGCAQCDLNQREMIKEKLVAWWDSGQSQCAANRFHYSLPKSLPQNLPDDRFVNMDWNLKDIDTRLGATKLTVEIKRFTTLKDGKLTGSYLLQKPRLEGPAAGNFVVKGIRILNNNKYQWYANAFMRINSQVSGKIRRDGTVGFPVLSPETVTILQDSADGDQLTLAIQDIAPAPTFHCRSFDTFKADVLPVIISAGCKGCHGIPGNLANTLFDMALADTELCDKAKEYTWSNPEVLPSLIHFPLQGHALGHPNIGLTEEQVNPKWINWIEAEWP